MSDLWEKQYNNGQLFDSTFDPQADPDNDAWTNAQEAAAGTDPFDANPPHGIVKTDITYFPVVETDTDNDGIPDTTTDAYFQLTWPSVLGKQYTVLFSTDLSPASWQPLGPPFTANGGTCECNIIAPPTADRLFWRVAIADVAYDNPGLPSTSSGFTLAEIEGMNRDAVLESFQDSDYDGISDAEEIANGFDPNSHDDDADGDGSSNFAEITGGTSTVSPASTPPNLVQISRWSDGYSEEGLDENGDPITEGVYGSLDWNIDPPYNNPSNETNNIVDYAFVTDLMSSHPFPSTPPIGSPGLIENPLAEASARAYGDEFQSFGLSLAYRNDTRCWIKLFSAVDNSLAGTELKVPLMKCYSIPASYPQVVEHVESIIATVPVETHFQHPLTSW